jgi:DsbC/DsbD-like thiol-disulfide interchange protein
MMEGAGSMVAKKASAAQMSAMCPLLRTAFALLFLASSQTTAFATVSDWQEVQGGRVRLVTAGEPGADGVLQGVLEIDLVPGWKTYWRDPGDAGVPPQVDVSKSINIASAEMRFPAPERFDDGFSKWAGYKHPVAFPITFTLKSPGEPATIEADVFLGICETICIPVQAQFALDPASDPDNADDQALVAAALDALPGPEQPDFGVTVLPGDGKQLLVEATVPDDPVSAEFFIAGEHGYMFGTPKRADRDGKAIFAVPILDRPAARPAEGALYYTLSTPAKAVEGTIPYP